MHQVPREDQIELADAIAEGARRRPQQAFGEACPELQRCYKMLLRDRTMVLAADNIDVVNGVVVVSPFSLAIFKADPRGGFPDINTITSKSARVEFDKTGKAISLACEDYVEGLDAIENGCSSAKTELRCGRKNWNCPGA